MQFLMQEDIEASIEDVYTVISDVDMVERVGLRRGIKAHRVNPDAPVGPGTEWQLNFAFRGKPRAATVKLASQDAPTTMSFESETDGLNVPVTIELVALSRSTTRMNMNVELQATTMTARLLVQSIRLAKSTLQNKLDVRMAQIGRGIEGRVAQMS